MSDTYSGEVMKDLLAVCPKCVRIVDKDDADELNELIDNHNEQRHGGERVAQVVHPSLLDEFMNDVKEEYGGQTHSELGTHIVEKDPWGILP